MEVIGIVSAIVLVLINVYLNWSNIQLKNQINTLLTNRDKELDDARKQSVTTSKAVIRGNINQEFIPLFNEFPYSLSDCKMSGQPVDYLCFNGMTAVRDGLDSDIEIILADVKTNTASLTKVQRAIKDAVNSGRVRFETWQIKDNKLIIK